MRQGGKTALKLINSTINSHSQKRKVLEAPGPVMDLVSGKAGMTNLFQFCLLLNKTGNPLLMQNQNYLAFENKFISKHELQNLSMVH